MASELCYRALRLLRTCHGGMKCASSSFCVLAHDKEFRGHALRTPLISPREYNESSAWSAEAFLSRATSPRLNANNCLLHARMSTLNCPVHALAAGWGLSHVSRLISILALRLARDKR